MLQYVETYVHRGNIITPLPATHRTNGSFQYPTYEINYYVSLTNTIISQFFREEISGYFSCLKSTLILYCVRRSIDTCKLQNR